MKRTPWVSFRTKRLIRMWSGAMLTLLIGLSAASSVQAEEDAFEDGTLLPTRAERATLFKNGYAIVERSARIPQAGTWGLEPLPSPAHGSLWITSSDDKMHVESVRSATVSRHETRPLATLGAIVAANPGRRLHLRIGEREVVARVVKGQAARAQDPRRQQTPYEWQQTPVPTGIGSQQTGLLVLETEAGFEWVQASEIRGIRVPTDGASNDRTPLIDTRRVPSEIDVLRVTTSGAGRLRIIYLTSGLTWAPSYRLRIDDSKAGQLEANALVMNDVETFEGTELRLATGFPNLAFQSVPSPLVPLRDPNRPIDAFLRALRGGGGSSNADPLANSLAVVGQQIAYPASGGSSQSWSTLGPAAGTSLGVDIEDFHLTSRPDVDLAPADRLAFEIDSVTIPTRTFYRWTIDDRVDQRNRFLTPGQRQDPLVRRILELENTAGRPWTTGPITIERDGLYVAQPILPYTPTGARTELEAGRGVDLRVRESEVEVGRDANVDVPWSGVWDRVEVEGTLEVANHSRRAAQLETRKTLSGEVLDDDGVVETVTLPDSDRNDRQNRQHLLQWNHTIEPGDTLTIRYRYTVLIRM